jgi:Uma2 family endonuclease
VTPAPRPAHHVIVDELGFLLSEYCRREGIGRASHGRPVLVTPESHTEPDIVGRQREVPPADRWDDVPLPFLVVEVLSESTRRYNLVKKQSFYLKVGVPEYWVVDGDARTVLVITPDGDRTESKALGWHPTGAREPFTLDLVSFFEEVLGPRLT